MSSMPPTYDVGENVSVLYNPINPYNAEICSIFTLWFGSFLFFGTGMILMGFGSYGFIARMKSMIKANSLLKNGRKIISEVDRVKIYRSSLFGKQPYNILSRWQDPITNKVHIFESEDIYFDPKEFIKINTIDIYVDPNNFENYYMDISFLSKKKKVNNGGKSQIGQ
jgi:hypothetical protein